MKRSFFAALTAFLLFGFHAFAKDDGVPRFGKIAPEDFTLHTTLDNDAAAIVIADIGDSYFETAAGGGLALVFKRYRRVKILTKNGFDAADVSIPIYHNDQDEEEDLTDIKAVTYNLEGAEIVSSKLERSSIFKDKLSQHLNVRKFTLPAVKVGSIIEYSYTLRSPFFFELQPWTFQGKYPRLWSEYKASIPDFYEYVMVNQGLQNFFIKTTKFDQTNFVLNGGGTVSAGVRNLHWVMKDVPPLKEEKFTTSLENYLARVTFQFSGTRYPNEPFKPYLENWSAAAKKLLERESFGATLGYPNNWLDDVLLTVASPSATPLEQTQKIYSYVRDNFTCTQHNALYLGATPEQTFKRKSGNDADINILLTAMLRRRKITSDPVILSTRDNGFTVDMYPLLDKYNYVICRARVDGKNYYLDAAHPYLGFGKLAADCYNGAARVINITFPETVHFDADSLLEKKVTMITIAKDPKDSLKMQGFFSEKLGNVGSEQLRETLKEKGEDAYFKKLQSAYAIDISLGHTEVEGRKDLDEPMKVKYDFNYERPKGSILYINPMMTEATTENYFKSAERSYPVEMPYAMSETYIFDFEIPAGYNVEELPKSQRVKLNETEGVFEYLIEHAEGHIRLQSTIKLRKTNFQPEDYESLRRFFAAIISKQAEQVVLKKI